MMRRFALVLFAIVPAMMLFFLPLAVYKIPLPVQQFYGRTVLVGGHALLTAVLACTAWFAIAIGIVLWPGTPAARPRPWTPAVLSGAFVGLSLVGSGVSVTTSFCTMPGAVAEVLHWISFAPVAAAVLGVYLLREPSHFGFREGVIWTLILLDLTVRIFVPIGLAVATPAAVTVVAILYGVNAVGLPARQQLAAAAVLCSIVVVAIPFRAFLRTALYHGEPFRARACLLGGHQPALRQTSFTLAAKIAPPAAPSPPVVVDDLPGTSRTRGRVSTGSSPVTAALRWPPLGGVEGILEHETALAVNRLNRLGDLAYVIAMTPSRVPYARGVTYLPIAGALVPRAVWPGKPLNDGSGQFYGHRYGFLAPSDKIHSYNLPVITEGWMNAGWIGVIASAAAVGLLLRLIWYWWLGDSGAPGNVVIGMAVVSVAVDQDSNLGLLVGGTLHALIIYGVLDYLLRRVRPAGGAA